MLFQAQMYIKVTSLKNSPYLCCNVSGINFIKYSETFLLRDGFCVAGFRNLPLLDVEMEVTFSNLTGFANFFLTSYITGAINVPH